MEKNEIRVMIDENKQKEIFRNFIKKFDNDFLLASQYLGISTSSLSKYTRAVVHYLPKNIFNKIINYLRIQQPEIIFSGSLNEIRLIFMRKAHPILAQRNGTN